MLRCPRCDEPRVLVVIGDSRLGLCLQCGARWVQDGSTQRQVRSPDAPSTGRRTS